MEGFQEKLHALFIEIYHNIRRLEEDILRRAKGVKLTISEMHLIEYVGRSMPTGLTIRKLAEQLKVKSPSVTVAVQKLITKGYVIKIPCALDGRAVRVQLTRDGRRVDAYHQYYHRMMIKAATAGTTVEEQTILLSVVQRLNDYFLESIEET